MGSHPSKSYASNATPTLADGLRAATITSTMSHAGMGSTIELHEFDTYNYTTSYIRELAFGQKEEAKHYRRYHGHDGIISRFAGITVTLLVFITVITLYTLHVLTKQGKIRFLDLLTPRSYLSYNYNSTRGD